MTFWTLSKRRERRERDSESSIYFKSTFTAISANYSAMSPRIYLVHVAAFVPLYMTVW
jgi:hypothetical protein